MGKSGKPKGGSASKKKTAGKSRSSAHSSSRRPGQAGPLVALYGLDAGSERGDAVRCVMDALGIAVRTIEPSNLNDPVGAICGMLGMRPSRTSFAGQAPEGEFMLVCNLSSAQLDKLLSAMREADASVAHKAQLTQFNRLWPLRKLMEEVAREHATISEAAKGRPPLS